MGKHLPFSCHDVELCAAALLDGQLSPAEEQLVEEHLESCESCCDLIDALGEQQLGPPRLQIIQNQDYWDEIFESVNMDFLPLEYMSLIIVKFKDGRIWEIQVSKNQRKDPESIEGALDSFFQEFEDDIDAVDFRMDLNGLKNDIGKRTRRFLKLNK